MNNDYLDFFVDLAIKEDIGSGDHTSLACIPDNKIEKAKLIIKQEGILAGVEIAKKVFVKFDSDVIFTQYLNDSDKVRYGDIAFEVELKVQALLKAERLVLNIMQRMSGIATCTNKYLAKLDGLNTKILDTRKTTPGFRLFEKEAVRIGGGLNHRMGLYDMIMIKDNHVDFSGGIENAISNTKKYLTENKLDLKIEVETRNLEEIEKVIAIGGIDRIMLDNFTPEQTMEAIKLINGKFETESSGGITYDTIRSYGECGVDFISVGALTHQVKSLDMSLKAI